MKERYYLQNARSQQTNSANTVPTLHLLWGFRRRTERTRAAKQPNFPSIIQKKLPSPIHDSATRKLTDQFSKQSKQFQLNAHTETKLEFSTRPLINTQPTHPMT
jgi:hypothetical protein